MRLRQQADQLRREGQTAMYVAVDGKPAGVVGVSDPVKDTTAQALRELRAEGLRIVMLTGDSRATAAAVAKNLGSSSTRRKFGPSKNRRL